MKRHYYLILIPVILMVLGQSFGKIGAGHVSLTGFSVLQFFNIFTIIACICLILRGFVWLILLRKFDLVFVYPFMSISYILILIVSCILFKEAITIGKIVGSFLITGGVFSISLGEKKTRRDIINV